MTSNAPFDVKDGTVLRLRSKKGLKNRNNEQDWYLAVVDKKLVYDGASHKHSDWTVKLIPNTNCVNLKSSAGDFYLGINEALQPICNADPQYSGKLELIWLPSGKLCIMSNMYRDKKNRTGGAGPHIGVEPKGGLIGNAGRGEWGQFDAFQIVNGEIATTTSSTLSSLQSTQSPDSNSDSNNNNNNNDNNNNVQKPNVDLPLSNPNSSSFKLLSNFTKHRELFGGNQQFVIEQKLNKNAKACLTVDITLPNMKQAKWCIIAPAPPSPMQIQNVTGASLKVYDSTGQQLLSGSDMIQDRNGHYLFRSLVKGGNHNQVKVKYEIQAQLYSISLKPVKAGDFVPSVVPLPADQMAYHLKPTSLMNFNDPQFAMWVNGNQLHPMLMSDGQVESVLCFAYRVHLFLKIHFSYVWAKDVKGRKATDTIQTKHTDCGGFCILFATIMRMHGIPARLLFGRWSTTAPEDSQNVHVKGEFYCGGIGWIPIDPASAITADHNEPYLKFYGNDYGNLICMHLDHNFDGIDTIVAGPKQMEFAQGISFWVDGAGNFNGQSVQQKWVVEEQKQ